MTKPVQTYVHTLGDSTIDNLYWLINSQGTNLEDAKQNCVEGQLQRELGEEYKVVSHAYDGFTTKDVLDGSQVGAVLPRNGNAKDTYMGAKRDRTQSIVAEPLNELAGKIREFPQSMHYVVISMGGNDFRENLTDPVAFFTSVPQIQSRYLEIAKRVSALGQNVRPILVLQYQTDTSDRPYYIYTGLGIVNGAIATVWAVALGCLALVSKRLRAGRIHALVIPGIFSAVSFASLAFIHRYVPFQATLRLLKLQRPGLAHLGALMERFYRPVLQQAFNNRLPILDLPNSLNPHDHSLYISAIEPSQIGGQKIAQGLAHIIRMLNTPAFGAQGSNLESMIFRCDGQVRGNNPNKWVVEYPKKPQ